MTSAIEIELLKIKSHIIDYSNIQSILRNLGYSKINDKIQLLKQQGILSPIKRGLYFHNSSIHQHSLPIESLANNIFGPSYISLEYALSYYGLIPERVFQLTSVTTKRSKKYSTKLGEFTYTTIHKNLFSLGLEIHKTDQTSFLIASKEKALCDFLYLRKQSAYFSINELKQLLEEDLRIDLNEISDFNKSMIQEYYQISKSKRIAIFNKLIDSGI